MSEREPPQQKNQTAPPQSPDAGTGGEPDTADHWIAAEDNAGRRVRPGPLTETPDTDPYRGLRNIESDDPLWPLDDPGTPPNGPPTSRIPSFIVGLLVGVILAAVSLAGFQLFSRDGEDATPAPSVTTTTEAPEPPTTTTSTTSTTSTTTTATPSIQPIGEPLAVDELRMAADAIGPILIGTPAAEALGRLATSLGQPDDDTGLGTADGSFGACAGEEVRIVHWRPLAVVVTTDEAGNEVFSAYRLDLAHGGLASRASTMLTISGLRAGDTVATLESIYSEFTIDYPEDVGIGLSFELRRQGTEDLLLRGPITSIEADGIVTGIYSPDACPS